MNEKKKHKEKVFSKTDFAIITTILVLGLILRLYRINIPLADWHSWRQADTAAVSRNFVKSGFDLMLPRFDDLSNTQSGKLNPQGFRMVEFPFFNAIPALLYKSIPHLPLEVYGRLTNIFFSLVLIAIIYHLLYKEEGKLAAIFGSLIFAVFPFFVYYSRVVLPDMTAISLFFSGILFLYIWGRGHFFYVLSIILSALALLIKPTVIFYFLPIFYIFYKKYGLEFFKKALFYGYIFLSLIPLALWRLWIAKFPEGIPASDWLFTSVNTSEGLQRIFLKPAFFRWIFEERILILIMGGYMVSFLILGILKKPKKSLLFYWMGIGALLYLLTFQGGNVQHDYYQIIILPPLAIFSAIGINFLLQEKKIFQSIFLNISLILIVILFSIATSYYRIKNYYSYSSDLTNIAKIISTVTEPNSYIITDTTGDTTLLYLADRRGYPVIFDDLTKLKKQGMQYMVTMNKDTAETAKKQFSLIFESDKVYIFKL